MRERFTKIEVEAMTDLLTGIMESLKFVLFQYQVKLPLKMQNNMVVACRHIDEFNYEVKQREEKDNDKHRS